MSIESWKKEFYPVPADRTKDPINHSLQKWKGATQEALAKHGLETRNGIICCSTTEAAFAFTDRNCALCVKYRAYPKGRDELRCVTCPIFRYKQEHNLLKDPKRESCIEEWVRFPCSTTQPQ